MIPYDLEQYKTAFPGWVERLDFACRNICILSPTVEQQQLLRSLFPSAKLHSMIYEVWDLNDPVDHKFDLIFAAGVFICSEDPERWFENVFRATKRLWLQDTIIRNRGGEEIFGPPDDNMRYRYTGVIDSNYDGAYDLKLLEPRIAEFIPYDCEPGFKNFIADIKGDVPEDFTTAAPKLSVGESLTLGAHDFKKSMRGMLQKMGVVPSAGDFSR